MGTAPELVLPTGKSPHQSMMNPKHKEALTFLSFLEEEMGPRRSSSQALPVSPSLPVSLFWPCFPAGFAPLRAFQTRDPSTSGGLPQCLAQAQNSLTVLGNLPYLPGLTHPWIAMLTS